MLIRPGGGFLLSSLFFNHQTLIECYKIAELAGLVIEFITVKNISMAHEDFHIRNDGRFLRIRTMEIKYVEACKNNIRIVTTSKIYTLPISLKQFQNELPADTFCQIHRSFIVSLFHITSFDRNSVYMDRIGLPVSSFYRVNLFRKVKIVTNDKRLRLGDHIDRHEESRAYSIRE